MPQYSLRPYWRQVLGVCILLVVLPACGVTNKTTAPSGGSPQSTTQSLSGTTVLTGTATAVQLQSTAVPTDTTTIVQPSKTAVLAGTGTALPAGSDQQFTNPVLNQDFPDPDTLLVQDTYYAYATNFGSTNVQVARSTDLVRWQLLSDALPFLPDWASPGFTWAPEVTAIGQQAFVLYFTARHTESQRQCIGAATSTTPEGPFTAVTGPPLICQLDQGGSIDASSFTESDGTRFILWKNDGNCCGQPTWISIQRLSADGLQLEGQPTQLITRDQPWEGTLVEAPTLYKHANTYYLFYSANNYAGAEYAIGYASADQLLGPYRKPNKPFVKTVPGENPVIGPGGQDIVTAPSGATWLVYHSWDDTVNYRGMSIDALNWEPNGPVVAGPQETAQMVPK